MKSNKKLLGRVLAMALAVVMVLGMPGVGQVFAAAGDPDDTTAITQDAGTGDAGRDEAVPGGDGAVVPDGIQEGAQEGAGDAQDGVPGEGGTPGQEGVQGGPEGVPGASDGDDIDQDQGQEQGPGSGDDVTDPGEGGDAAAALAFFQAACQAFLSEFDHEKAMHLDGQDHACAYRDFGMFLEKFNAAVFTDVDLSAEPEYIAMMDAMDAKLSEAAVSVYVFRGEAVLGRSYDDLDAFDSDAGRMDDVLRYMLPADSNGVTVAGMAGRIAAARDALAASLAGDPADPADPENPGTPGDAGDPENPEDPEIPEQPEQPAVPESVQAVRDAYAAFCGDIDGMAFDMILAELDRISGLVSAVMPEDMTEDVAAVAGYLPGIRSERALAEFCDRILAIRDKAAAGAYDNKSEDFDREAARAEFDAVRGLKIHMLEAELASENYINGLKILANLETLMDTPVEQGLSEKAKAFLADVEDLQSKVDTEYAGRPYALDKAVSNLLTECTKLDPADLLDENVQAAKTALENMLRRIVVKLEIRAFLDAAYALLGAVGSGLDLESDQAAELAAAVVSAMDLLTESDMENIEVSEAYQKLSDAGLVPGSGMDDAFMNFSGTVTRDGFPVSGIEVAVFSVLGGNYTLVTQTKAGEAVDILTTDADGQYAVSYLVPGEHVVAIRGLKNVAPAGGSFVSKVDGEIGLDGWDYICSPDCMMLGDNVVNFEFESIVPVEMTVNIWEQANSSGFVSGKSGVYPADEDKMFIEFGSMPSDAFSRAPHKKGDPIASFNLGDIFYMVVDVRVTSKQGASDVDISFNAWDSVSDYSAGGSDVLGVYELDVSGRPTRELSSSEYSVVEPEGATGFWITLSDDLMAYGKSYRVIVKRQIVWGLDPYGCIAYCDCCPGLGPNAVTGQPYIADMAHYVINSFRAIVTDMEGNALPGAEFQLFTDEACTRPLDLFSAPYGDNSTGYYTYADGVSDTVKELLRFGGMGSVDNTFNTIVTQRDPSAGDVFLYVQGLKSGTYYLKQTKYVDGYEAEDGGSGITTIYVNNCDGRVVENDTIVVKNRKQLPPYEVNITWLDMPGATLSEDRTHADIAGVPGSAVADDLRIDITFNADVPADTVLLTWPVVLWECPAADALCMDGQSMVLKYKLYAFNAGSGLSVTDAFNDDAVCKLFTTDSFAAGTKLSIPLRNSVRHGIYENSRVTGLGSGSFWFDGLAEYCFIDGLSNRHVLTFSRSACVNTLSVGPRGSYKSPVGNNRARVWSWNPSVQSLYGVTKEDFETLSAQGELFFEYGFKVDGSADSPAYLDFAIEPSQSGSVRGFTVRTPYNNSNYGVAGAITSSPLEGFDGRVPLTLGSYSSTKGSADYFINWLDGSWSGKFSSMDVYGAYVWALVSYPKDEILTADAEKTEASCELIARLSLAETGDYLEQSHTEMHLEPLNHFTSDGSMYSLDTITGIAYFCADAAGTSLLLGSDPVYAGGNGYDYINLVADGTFRFSDGDDPDCIALSIDALGCADVAGGNKSFVMLGSGDYVLRSLYFMDLIVGTAYFDDNDELLSGSVDYDTYGDDVLRLYVCRAGAPDTWILDREFYLRDIRAGTTLAFNYDDVLRVKLEYPEHRSFVNMRVIAECDVKNGPIVSDVAARIRSMPDDSSLSRWSFPFYASLHVIDADGSPKLVKPVDHISGTLAADVNQLSSVLYNGWYKDGEYPLRNSSSFSFSHHGQNVTPLYSSRSHEDADRNTDYVDFWIGGAISAGGILPETFRGSCLENMHEADFYLIVPPWCEVVSIVPGFTGASFSTYNSTRVPSQSLASNANPLYWPEPLIPELDYDLDVHSNGITSLLVRTNLEYDRIGNLKAWNGNRNLPGNCYKDLQNFYYGGFTVRVVPRYASVFTSQPRIEGFFCVSDESGYFDGAKIVRCSPDDGKRVNYGTGSFTFFSDVDGDGDTTDRFVRSGFGCTAGVSQGIQVSGLQLAAQGSDNQFWNRSVTAHAGDPYSYRLTYSQMAETSKNVVLFDSLEDIAGNTWTGSFASIDLSDAKAKGLSVKVYANEKNIDSVKYVQDNITGDDLTAGYDGWILLTECTPDDLGSYDHISTWWWDSNAHTRSARSIAFDFGEQEFAKDQAGKPNAVQVYLRMRAPMTGFNNGSNPIQNRAFYSDVLTGSGKARSVMANTATVDLVTTVDYEMSKTITDCWVSAYTDTGYGDGSSGDGIIDTATPDVPSDTGWIVAYGPEDAAGGYRKLTLDKSGKPANDFEYSYTMRYAMADPGKGKYDSVCDLVLYDEIESGSDSRYAGRLDNIVVSGQAYRLWQDLSMLDHTFSSEFFSFSQNLDSYQVFVSYPGVVADVDLPDGLAETTGRSDWTQISDLGLSEVPEDSSVTAVAVFLPEMHTVHESGEEFIQSFVSVSLNMVHGDKPNANGVGRVMKNGFTVAFMPSGTNEYAVDSRPDQTELEVVYKATGVVLPVTGGPGVKALCVMGLVFLVPAAFALVIKKRKGDSI